MTRPTFARACLRGLLGFTGLMTLALVVAVAQNSEAIPAPTSDTADDETVSQARVDWRGDASVAVAATAR